jgi:hypothetical protein
MMFQKLVPHMTMDGNSFTGKFDREQQKMSASLAPECNEVKEWVRSLIEDDCKLITWL